MSLVLQRVLCEKFGKILLASPKSAKTFEANKLKSTRWNTLLNTYAILNTLNIGKINIQIIQFMLVSMDLSVACGLHMEIYIYVIYLNIFENGSEMPGELKWRWFYQSRVSDLAFSFVYFALVCIFFSLSKATVKTWSVPFSTMERAYSNTVITTCTRTLTVEKNL